MLGEVFVALITSLGAVWVAHVSLRGGSRRVSRRYNKPLMDLCALWGRTRGVAEAAVDDCVQAAGERREEAASRTALTAARRDELFRAETEPTPELYEALRGEFSVGSDGLLTEFGMYADAVKQFRTELRKVGDRIEALSPASRLSEIGIERYLDGLRNELRQFDEAFERCVGAYLQRKDGVLFYQVRRRLRRQAKHKYDTLRHSVRGVFVDGSETADHPDRSEGAAQGGNEPPPCGYCIWRCPHAPARTRMPDDPAMADLTGERGALTAPRV